MGGCVLSDFLRLLEISGFELFCYMYECKQQRWNMATERKAHPQMLCECCAEGIVFARYLYI